MTEDYKTTTGAPPDWRGLCAELLSRLEESDDYILKEEGTIALAARARAAMAEPEPKVAGPTYSEVLAIRDKLDANGYGTVDLVAFARAVLARWGNHFPDATKMVSPPAEGEVAELVAWLRGANWDSKRQSLATRAADLLEQRQAAPVPVPDDYGVLPVIVSKTGADDEPELERIICASISGGADYENGMPRELSLKRVTPEGSTFARYVQTDFDPRLDVRPAPVPVAVSERLPGPEDCDADGRCWWFAAETEVDFGAWTFGTSEACTGDNWGHTHWLPATALPLPQGEVE